MIDINIYHWVWYLIGFILVPRLTFMIWVTLYFPNKIPETLLVIGWFFALISSIVFKGKD